MHPYNQAMPNRPVQHANAGAPGTDRGAHLMPNGNSMGLGRSMPMPRPGFTGIAASSALNSSNMIAPGVVGVSGSMNIHTSSSSPQGGSMLRPREALHVVRVSHLIYYAVYPRCLTGCSLFLVCHSEFIYRSSKG